jgi:hypothetical protein
VHCSYRVGRGLAAEGQHERAPGEEAPIELILSASADAEQVELLELDAKSIRVSEYLTELPPLPLLRASLHQAIEHERGERRPPTSCGRGPQMKATEAKPPPPLLATASRSPPMAAPKHRS